MYFLNYKKYTQGLTSEFFEEKIEEYITEYIIHNFKTPSKLIYLHSRRVFYSHRYSFSTKKDYGKYWFCNGSIDFKKLHEDYISTES